MDEWLEKLTLLGYSPRSVRTAHWALRSFLLWAQRLKLTAPDAVTHALLEAWQCDLARQKNATGDFLAVTTQLARLGYGQRFSVSGLGNLVRQLLDAAGVPVSGSCHLFRHTCATQMLEGGADIRVIQQLLGHARLDTTAIYAEVRIAHLKEVHARCHPHGGPATGDHRNCELPPASNPC